MEGLDSIKFLERLIDLKLNQKYNNFCKKVTY